jgi:hypothetical protein
VDELLEAHGDRILPLTDRGRAVASRSTA